MEDRTLAGASPLTRRKVLGGAAALALTALHSPSIVIAGERRLRVSTFGGYFERMFAEHIYPAFTKATGITVQSIELIPRPTPLPNGLEAWLNTFRNGVLDQLAPRDRASAIARTVALLKPILCDADGNWTADYVRLRFKATRP